MEEIQSPVGETNIESILAIDVGAVLTKATLIARVEGTYRVVAHREAPSTVEPPWLDARIGVDHALEQLKAVTGRACTDDKGMIISPEHPGGRGVDVCVLTASAAHPLKLVLVGLSPDLSMASLQHAVASTYAEVAEVLTRSGASSADGEAARRLSEEDRVRYIYRSRPDLICIVGGTDGGAEMPVLEMVDSVALAASLLADVQRPRILFAGNSNLRAQVAEIIGTDAELQVADNVRPSAEVENLSPVQSELESLYQGTKITQIPGMEKLCQWSRLPVVPTARAIARVAQYLSLEDKRKGTLAVDVGAASTTIAAARAGQVHLHVQGDVGTAAGARHVLTTCGLDAIMRWIPIDVLPGQIEAVVTEKEVHPTSVAQDMTELLIEQAIAREAIRLTLPAARTGWPAEFSGPYVSLLPYLEPIIGGGSVLGRAPRPGQAALMLLDSLEPIGITTLVLDTAGLVPALGAAALAEPLAMVQALASGGLVTLGTVVTPVGRARVGETIMSLRIKYRSGGDLGVDVTAGSLEVLPLPPGEKAVLELRPRAHIDVGRGGPGRGGGPVEVQGGSVGLIIDARGRPLTLPSDTGRRRERVQQWLWDMGA